MYQILKQRERVAAAKLLRADAKPQRFEWNDGKGEIVFSDGGKVSGSCIRCPNMPCIEYQPAELSVAGFSAFPSDLDQQVCPTAAITWDIEADSPSVNLDECISCGLCVSRCPVAAIEFDALTGASVNDAENAYFQLADIQSTQAIVDKTISEFAGVSVTGRLSEENDAVIESVHQRILGKIKSTPKLPQHLTRNLLLALGNDAAMRRQGDVNIRMEIVFSNADAKGIAEVELGAGVLDAPRNILDNIAVLHSRYGIPKNAIAPLIVSLSLPNNRVEYWEVIKNIYEALGVRVGSVTLVALMLLLWERKTFPVSQQTLFYSDSATHSIRESLEMAMGRKLNLTLGHYGAAESSK